MDEANCDTVVVAARDAHPDYLALADRFGVGAYVCPAGRAFRDVGWLAFYAGGAIQPEVPRILERRDGLDVSAAGLRRLRRRGGAWDAELVALLRLLGERGRLSGEPVKALLLSAPADPATTLLPRAVPALLGGRAWVRSRRYTSRAALLRGPASAAELEALAAAGS